MNHWTGLLSAQGLAVSLEGKPLARLPWPAELDVVCLWGRHDTAAAGSCSEGSACAAHLHSPGRQLLLHDTRAAGAFHTASEHQFAFLLILNCGA